MKRLQRACAFTNGTQALGSNAQKKEDRHLIRVTHYIVQLAVGQGSAGTPLPMQPNSGGTTLPKVGCTDLVYMCTHSGEHIADDVPAVQSNQL